MPWRWLILGAVAMCAVVGGPRLTFEKDLRQLNAQPKTGAGIRYGSATGRCSKSVVLVAEDDLRFHSWNGGGGAKLGAGQ